MNSTQLSLDHIDPPANSVPRPHVIYPRILSLSEPTVCSCVLQDIRNYHTDALVGRFVYLSHRGTHKQLLSGWKRRLRAAGIAMSESRHASRTSKELCLQQHRGREAAATPRASRWYRQVAKGKLRFKKPKRTECIEVMATIGTDSTPCLGTVTCVLIPAIDAFLVVKVVYDVQPAHLGFVGSRRRSLLDRIQAACVRHWKRYSTHDMFI